MDTRHATDFLYGPGTLELCDLHGELSLVAFARLVAKIVLHYPSYVIPIFALPLHYPGSIHKQVRISQINSFALPPFLPKYSIFMGGSAKNSKPQICTTPLFTRILCTTPNVMLDMG